MLLPHASTVSTPIRKRRVVLFVVVGVGLLAGHRRQVSVAGLLYADLPLQQSASM